MKKKSLFLIITSSILGLGIILVLIGLAFGGRIYSFSIGKNTKFSSKSVSHQLPAISLSDTKDIQNLNFDLSANDIEIKTGNEFSVQGGRLSKNTVENGVWTVKSYYSDYFYTFEIFGLDLPFPRFWNKKEGFEKLTITIPQDIKLQKVSMDVKATRLNIDLLNCDTFDLDVAASDASIHSILAADVDISVSAGQLDIDQYQISQSAEIECSVGDLNFGKKQYAKENVCSNLDATCSLGNTDVYGKLTNNSSIECSLGDVTLRLTGGQANYSVSRSSASFGDISYHTEKDHPASDSHEVYGTLDIDCTMGNIDIYYLGNES